MRPPRACERNRGGRIFIAVGRVACTCSELYLFVAARAWAGSALGGSLIRYVQPWNMLWATVAVVEVPRDSGSIIFDIRGSAPWSYSSYTTSYLSSLFLSLSLSYCRWPICSHESCYDDTFDTIRRKFTLLITSALPSPEALNPGFSWTRGSQGAQILINELEGPEAMPLSSSGSCSLISSR